MVSKLVEVIDIVGGAAGTVGVATLPRGGVIERIDFRIGDTAAGNANAPAVSAILAGLQFKANGGIQRNVLASRMAAINALNKGFGPKSMAGGTFGLPAGNGNGRTVVSMHFREPWRTRTRNNSVDTAVMGFPTAWLPEKKPAQVYFNVAAGITPSIRVFALINPDDQSSQFGPRPLMKWYSEDDNVNTATANLVNFQKGVKDGDRFSQISIFNTSDAKTPDQVRLELSGLGVLYEDVPVSFFKAHLESLDLDPTSADAILSGLHLVFDANDALDDTIPGNIANAILKITLSAAAAGTLPTVTQRWGLPD